MLPEPHYSPTLALETFRDLTIPSYVALNLGYPPLCPAREEACQAVSATPLDFFRVAVPHVSIHEHSQSTRPDDDIGATRHVSSVETVA
jgi:hypothetical protein